MNSLRSYSTSISLLVGEDIAQALTALVGKIYLDFYLVIYLVKIQLYDLGQGPLMR